MSLTPPALRSRSSVSTGDANRRLVSRTLRMRINAGQEFIEPRFRQHDRAHPASPSCAEFYARNRRCSAKVGKPTAAKKKTRSASMPTPRECSRSPFRSREVQTGLGRAEMPRSEPPDFLCVREQLGICPRTLNAIGADLREDAIRICADEAAIYSDKVSGFPTLGASSPPRTSALRRCLLFKSSVMTSWNLSRRVLSLQINGRHRIVIYRSQGAERRVMKPADAPFLTVIVISQNNEATHSAHRVVYRDE